jgi:hypothetical protein
VGKPAILSGASYRIPHQHWLDYIGLWQEEALGWGWKVSIHPADLRKLMDTWLGLLATGEPGEEVRL